MASLVAWSILGAEVISLIINYYIYINFKCLCGQLAAPEICVIFLEVELSLLATPAQLFLRMYMRQQRQVRTQEILTKYKGKAFAMGMGSGWTRDLERLSYLSTWRY